MLVDFRPVAASSGLRSPAGRLAVSRMAIIVGIGISTFFLWPAGRGFVVNTLRQRHRACRRYVGSSRPLPNSTPRCGAREIRCRLEPGRRAGESDMFEPPAAATTRRATSARARNQRRTVVAKAKAVADASGMAMMFSARLQFHAFTSSLV